MKVLETANELKDGKRLLSSEHYGTEIILLISEHEKENIQRYIENYVEVLRVNFFPVIS